MKIREAHSSDQSLVSNLILTIINQMELKELVNFTDNDKINLITQAYNLERLLDYTDILLAEIDGKIVGMSYSYPADVEMQTRADILKSTQGIDLHPNQEAWPEEWYLEMLSVNPNYRGHGIGKALIEATIESARLNDFEKISLNVDNSNPRAEKLYSKQGFSTVSQIMIGEHAYKHMIKALD
ncbi:GNAT family N-acetyltransferase [Periweissella fabalis]|uniref:GNAT family N-acetyltransferase n=1 Tax=Periweissella fabalis TaxID=1070421 RepID=A0A7X6S441_9LACO|nr:GNAT family N-acetyltransferase [Periweissella fabalis]MCM0598814.1 GNAT family N-acetyltransferase [Periweissella fabalis]NKZ24587.1 GNAT family N-acetyltransferase [Periweissella fabalis]